MRKWIRWEGLFAFAVTVALIGVLWYIFVDVWVERAIEKAGTRLVGAKVELESADVSLLPIGLALREIRVTNPHRPVRNAVEIKRVAFGIDGAGLIRRKAIIEEMSLEGVRFDTSRKTSGALPGKEKEVEEEKKAFRIPSFELPGVEEVISKEGIGSVALAESIRKEIRDERLAWQERIEDLPDSEKFREYEKRIKGLRPEKRGLGGVLGAAGEIQRLREDIQEDIARIEEAMDGIVKARESLAQRVEEARRTAEGDFKRIREKYGLPADAFASATRLLVGERAATWARRGIFWYRKLRPPVERAVEKRKRQVEARPPRGEGVDVIFPERPPVPDFFLRKAVVEATVKGMAVSGTLANVSAEQEVTGVPLTYEFYGGETDKAGSLRLEGKFDRMGPVPEDALRLSVKGYRIKDASLLDSAEVPLVLRKGMADFTLNALIRGGELDAVLTGRVTSADFSLELKEDDNQVLKSLAGALEGVRRFSISVKAAGALEDYSLGISSDLDRVLGDAVGREFRRRAGQWEEALRAAVMKKADIEGLLKSVGGFGGMENELDGRVGTLRDILKDAAIGKALPLIPF